jgi:hypothetical protein
MTSRSKVRSWSKVGTLVVGVGLALTLLLAVPASAKDRDMGIDDDDQIVLSGRLLVGSDETVDSAVIFNGSALIEGTVRESVFVLNGDAEISGTVREDVVVVNGDLVVRDGARIDGDLVTQGAPVVEEGATVKGDRQSVTTRFDFEGWGLAGRFAWWIGYSVSVLILGLLLLAFAPRLADAVRSVVRPRTGASIGWGLGLFFLIPIAAVLLLITVVGIPLGFFVLLALAFIYTLGYTVASIGVGSFLVNESQSRFLLFLAGWLILRVLALIPFVGGLVWLVASVWGLGLLAVAIRSEHAPVAITASVPPPPPMPVAG